MTAAGPSRLPRYTMSHLHWRVHRSTRVFRVRVVEPRDYADGSHGKLFAAVLASLLSPPSAAVDASGGEPRGPSPDEFDLVTFPEAFVPVETFLQVVARLVEGGWSGCLHVGLRPSEDGGQHLFPLGGLKRLKDRLESLAPSVACDLRGFGDWLGRASQGNYNVACLLTVDVENRVRLCLHPKAVKSKFEVSPLPEHTMTEADLLVLVTLVPDDRSYLSTTIQPLICADFLDLPMDRPGATPVNALTQHADCFPETLPDHVDVVSVATCTPQTLDRQTDETEWWRWHEQFRRAFLSGVQGSGSVRHRFAVVVLSNYLGLPKKGRGGLSGAFLPVGPRHEQYPAEILVSTWGKPKGSAENRWSGPKDRALASWSNRGFIASLDPCSTTAGADVRIFAFDVHRLPREQSPWNPDSTITNCRVLSGRFDNAGSLTFEPREAGNDR